MLFWFKGDFLAFPKFSFHIDDHDVLLVYGSDVGPSTNKIHWSSTDGLNLKGSKSSLSPPQPMRLPSHKPNPSKDHYKRITTVDLHQYFGFRTLKNIEHFKTVSLPTVTLIPAGTPPMSIGDITTVNRHTSNKTPVSHPTKFFDAAHIDIFLWRCCFSGRHQLCPNFG